MPRQDRPPKGSHGGRRDGAGRPRGPNGRGAAFKHLRNLARSHSEEALLTIVNLMQTSKDAWLRLACANAILDRAFGKPMQGEVMDQLDRLDRPHPTMAEIEADLNAHGITIDFSAATPIAPDIKD